LKDGLDLSDARRKRAINLLEQSGAITADTYGRLRFSDRCSVRAAVTAAVEIAEEHQRLIRSQIDMMRGYADTTGCRRQYLLGYFGEQLDQPCGNCDTCLAGALPATQPYEQPSGDDHDGFAPNSHVRHHEWGDGVVMRVADDQLTVLFETHGYKTLSRKIVEANNLLIAADA
jgi:ATP-dependent DNA helicase RecQ